jgi:hypothetical protein
MFVRADNRSFQNELDQEMYQHDEQTQEAQVLDGGNRDNLPMEVVPLTAEAIKSVPLASSAKRKHGPGSSVATIGSSDLDMMVSDEADPFAHDENMPSTSHQEFTSPTPPPNKLGGIVESLQNCWTAGNEPGALGRSEPTISGENQVMGYISESDALPSKAPEMQERTGGFVPFVTLPPAGHVETVDLMDIDLEHELQEN